MSAARLTRDEILSRLDVRILYGELLSDFRPNGAADVNCRCLFHDDAHASLSVNVETGLFKCHAPTCGAKGSPVDLLMRVRGIQAREALRELADRVGGNGTARPRIVPEPEERKHADAPWPTFRGAKLVNSHDYTLGGGAGRAVKVRYQRPDGWKTFLWFEVDPGGGFWSGLGGKKADLYCLDAVRAGIERGAVLVLNEGEKATDRATDHDGDDSRDFAATCGPNGAESFYGGEDGPRLAEQLRGAGEVLAVVDRDEAGATWAADVLRHVGPVVGRLRFVQAAVDVEKADLYDHLEAGFTLGELVPIEAAPAPGLHVDLPAVLVPGTHITDSGEAFEVGADDFVEPLVSALPPGVLYRRGTILGEIIGDSGNARFETVRDARLRVLVDRHVRLSRWQMVGRGEKAHLDKVFVPCGNDHAHLIADEAVRSDRIRELGLLVSYPVYAGRSSQAHS